MVYLHPPFYVINGVSLLPDHADPLQWYYMPLWPHFTSIQDASGLLVPSLLLVLYTGTAGSGGFINCDVNIGIDPDALDDIATQLKNKANLADKPRVVPLPLVDGSVKMILLDKASDAPPPPAGTTPPATQIQFVEKFVCPAKPALYGDNQAALSAELTQWGATVLEQALTADLTPIGVVYALDFYALRDAYSVTCSVHWDRVQSYLDEQFSVGVLFFSSDIDKAVDKLIENRDIELDVDTFVPEGEDTSTIIADRDRAVTMVREMITNAFFTSSIDPVKREDGVATAEGVADRVSQLAVTGGMASLASFSYKKVDYTRIDQKELDVRMNERVTVKQTIYPQGHIAGLASVLKTGGVDLNKFIMHVSLDNPFFQRRKVTAYFPRSFDAEGISTIETNFTYNANIQTVVLNSSTPSGSVDWQSQIVNGAMKREVSANFKVNFTSEDSAQRPLWLSSTDQVFSNDVFSVETSDLYQITAVPIHALPPFPWDRYPQIDVQVQYVDKPNAISLQGHYLLDKDHSEFMWSKFMRDPTKPTIQYKLIYYTANNQAIEKPWVDTDLDEIRIVDPFPSKRTLLIVPDLLWTDVTRAFVDVTYSDPDNGVNLEQQFNFDAANSAPQSFVADLRNPNQRRMAYQITIIMKDTQVITVPVSYTLASVLIVTAAMRGHKIIAIQPAAVAFADVNLQLLTVQVRYVDNTNGISFQDVFKFQSEADQATFEYDYVDPQNANFQYALNFQYSNGFIRTTNWTQGTGDLVIPISGV
jgi:hypothetical protein